MSLVPETAYADSNGVSIAYQVFGSGERDLVIAPGFMSHLDLQWTIPSFGEFAERLASFARVIIFDKRGTGLSDPAPGGDRFDVRMEDILAVMDAAGSPSATLFGMSEGGPLAVVFASSHPARVERLILYGTFARGSAIPDDTYRRLEEAVAQWGQGLTAEIFSHSAGTGFRRRIAGMLERSSVSPSMARALIGAIRASDVTAILPTITAPTMVIHRLRDPFADPAWAREMTELVPGAIETLLDDDEHVPWFGDVASLVSAVQGFVTGTSAQRPTSRILATVMFTDIVKSTETAGEVGDVAWRSLLERHNTVTREEVEGRGGRAVKSTGDGFLLVFDSPASAIDAARRIRSRVEDLGLELRIGIHTGECEVVDDNELAGVAVHIAARIVAEGRPGEILVSGTVKDLVVGSPHTFDDRGVRTLKGVPGEWRLYAVSDTERMIIDITRPQLRVTDRLSVFLAKQAPDAMRSLTSLVGDRDWAERRERPDAPGDGV